MTCRAHLFPALLAIFGNTVSFKVKNHPVHFCLVHSCFLFDCPLKAQAVINAFSTRRVWIILKSTGQCSGRWELQKGVWSNPDGEWPIKIMSGMKPNDLESCYINGSDGCLLNKDGGNILIVTVLVFLYHFCKHSGTSCPGKCSEVGVVLGNMD